MEDRYNRKHLEEGKIKSNVEHHVLLTMDKAKFHRIQYFS